jgi:hypothetical protein
VRFQTPKPHKACHLAGGAPPKTHETATSTHNPAVPGTKWHSRAAPLHEVALPCDFRPQNRTTLPPRGRSTPENARNCHLDRQPRHPGHEVAFPCGPTSRGGTPVRFQTPKPAQSCHLAGGAPPKPHETATSTRKPTTPAPRSAPLGGGCRIRRSFQSLGGGSAPTYWRSTAPDRVTATQCRAGRGGATSRGPAPPPRPRAATDAPGHRRNRAGSADFRGARPKPCPPEAPPNHPRRTLTEPDPPHATNPKSNPAHPRQTRRTPHRTRPAAHTPNATARQLKGNRELVPRSSHLARRRHRMRSSVQNSLGWSTVCHLRVARANYAEE